MKAIQLKNQIITLIKTKIGTYRQGNVAAIWIGNVPFGQIAEGLEVQIPSFPEFVKTGNRITSERWSIHLTQFPVNDGKEYILEAIELLKEGLVPHPDVTFIDRPSGKEDFTNDLPFLPTATLRYEINQVWRI